MSKHKGIKPGKKADTADIISAACGAVHKMREVISLALHENGWPKKDIKTILGMKFCTNDPWVIQVAHGVWWTPNDGFIVSESMVEHCVLVAILDHLPHIRVIKFEEHPDLRAALKATSRE